MSSVSDMKILVGMETMSEWDQAGLGGVVAKEASVSKVYIKKQQFVLIGNESFAYNWEVWWFLLR